MPCYHPKYAIIDGVNPDTGKDHLTIIPGATYESMHSDPALASRLVTLPCGQCIGCRIDYSREWSARCCMELPYHKSSYWCTFTYDDEHLPIDYYCNFDGCYVGASTNIRDVQLLVKRLRKDGQQIRYFGCSDYGGSTYRPHYHIMLFGLVLDDLRPMYQFNPGYRYYLSDYLSHRWGLGNVIIGEANHLTASYTAKYMCSKLKGFAASWYTIHAMDPPRALMSRRPGIGQRYFLDHPQVLDYKYFNLPQADGAYRVYLPRYFKRLESLADPDKAFVRSQTGKYIAERSNAARLQHTDVSFEQLLLIDERQRQSDYVSLDNLIVI